MCCLQSVFRIIGGADGRCDIGGHHRTSHNDGAGYAVGAQVLYGLLHGIHGGGHESAQSYCVGVLVACGIKHNLLGHILAQVGHAESVTLHYNLDNILAYVMHVALDGCNNQVTLGGLIGTCLSKLLGDDGKGKLGGLGRPR